MYFIGHCSSNTEILKDIKKEMKAKPKKLINQFHYKDKNAYPLNNYHAIFDIFEISILFKIPYLLFSLRCSAI